MLSCWHGRPEKRPTFNSLQMDLDDFAAVVEEKYNYPSADFMEQHEMTSTIQIPRANKRQRKLDDRRQHTPHR